MPITNEIKFEAIPTGDETTDDRIVESGVQRNFSNYNVKSWAFKAFQFTMVAIATYSFTRMRYTTTTTSLTTTESNFFQVQHSPCGNSAEEARAAGCHFEVLSWAWQADECHDIELENQFKQLDDWRFFRDKEGTIEIPPSEYGQDERRHDLIIWGSRNWHIVHCLYMWRKMHRAPQLGLRWDEYMKDFAHTMHCNGVLQNDTIPHDALTTKMRTGFPSC